MVRTLLVVCALAAAAPAGLRAQTVEVPAPAREGLEALSAAGADAAIAAWLEGTSFDSPATRATLAQGFARLEEQLGRLTGHDVVHVLPVGSHIRRVYAVLHYERGPAFLFLELYRAAAGWGVLTVEFNGNPETVFPPALLEP